MDELHTQAAELKQHWDVAFQAARGSPNLWQPYLKGISLSVLNEAVDTLVAAISRVRTPKGFYPIYQMARNFSANSLSGLIQISQQLEAGQYQQLPNFSGGIVTALGAVHTMTVYAPREAPETAIADMSIQFAQATAVLNTAQREFGEKLDALQRADELAAKIQETYTAVKQLEGESTAALEVTEGYREASEVAYAETEKTEKTIQAQALEVEKLFKSSQTLDTQLRELTTQLADLNAQTELQSEIIHSILPRAASAGLAAAFATRGKTLEPVKLVWMLIFIGTTACLAYFAHDLLKVAIDEKNFWTYLLYRITLAAPLVWLGWVSAVQYGNIVRVQEDYAFKEATSKAFQGYRDHMEHLATVNSDEEGNAMRLLAVETIKILAREPLRIYGHTHGDASPMQKAADKLGEITDQIKAFVKSKTA